MLSIPTTYGLSIPGQIAPLGTPGCRPRLGDSTGVREGQRSTSERLLASCCTLGLGSPVPGGFVTDSIWVCWPVGARVEVSHHPHGAFSTLFLSTSPLSVRPRAGCLSGQEPGLRLFLGPNQRALQSRCCGPKRMLSFLLVHPTASPGSPWLPPVACLPPLPRAGRAMDALAGCPLRRWQKRGAIRQSDRDTPKVGCDIRKPFSCLVHVANMPWAAALTRPSPGHQGCCCLQNLKPRKIQARENPHDRAAGQGAAPRAGQGQCQGRHCVGWNRDRPSWRRGGRLSAKGWAVGALHFGVLPDAT